MSAGVTAGVTTIAAPKMMEPFVRRDTPLGGALGGDTPMGGALGGDTLMGGKAVRDVDLGGMVPEGGGVGAGSVSAPVTPAKGGVRVANPLAPTVGTGLSGDMSGMGVESVDASGRTEAIDEVVASDDLKNRLSDKRGTERARSAALGHALHWVMRCTGSCAALGRGSQSSNS
eukprot:gene11823-biopygen14958